MAKTISTIPLRERFNISRLAIDYSWLTISFWIAVVVAGAFAFSSLKYALFPDITFPVVVVNASAPLTTALDTEAKLTELLERQLQSLPRLDDIRSTTYPGQTVLSLSFEVGADLADSNRRVKAEIERLKLPSGAKFQAIALNLNESAVASYAITSSSQTLAQLKAIAQQQIVPEIAKLPGVLKAELLGIPRSQKLPVSGANAIRFNGQDALAIQVIKQGNANTLEVASQVEQAVQKLRNLPGVTLTLAVTQANYIREATQATIEALGLAIALSVVVIFPFLWNWKATLISALAIPTSLLGTFIVMAMFGFNLETITLLALALIVGIIVDDAIVDVENISRHLELGESPRHAAISATGEIGLTVTAATLTIVAVFLPVGLMGGTIGQFFKPFGITVSAAVIVSLLVARTLSPLLAVWWLKPHPAADRTPQLLPEKVIDSPWDKFTQAYRRVLQWALRHRFLVLSLAILSLILGIALIPLIPKGFIPKLDRGEFNIRYTAPLPADPREALANSPTTPAQVIDPLNSSLQVAKQLEAFVRKSPQVQTVFTIVGARSEEPNRGTLYVKLKDKRSLSTFEVQDRFRQSLPQLSGVATSVEDIPFVDTGEEKPLQITLQGKNLALLEQTAQAIKARIQKLPGFVEVTATGDDNKQLLQGKSPPIFKIERFQSQRVAYINANLSQAAAIGDATDRAVAIAQTLLPPRIAINLGGDSARIRDIFSSFGTTLLLSVACILIVLLLLFRNWADPLVIAFSLPLSLAGAMIATLFTGSPFGMISVIGIIFLLGLTNKNAILIVDYINQLRQAGMSRTEAILTAAPIRLRPILMTTAATILGMLPIALGWGAGAELRAPMAIAIIGGLVASTILSLLVVPVVYALLDNVPLLKQRRFSP